jgi:hypothetical protein
MGEKMGKIILPEISSEFLSNGQNSESIGVLKYASIMRQNSRA